MVGPYFTRPPRTPTRRVGSTRRAPGREGDRDLIFDGWVIGYAQEINQNYGTKYRGISVTIVATDAGNLVIQACRWQEAREVEDLDAPLETREVDHCAVAVFNPEESWSEDRGVKGALQWRRDDAGGKLGRTSKVAWMQACENWSVIEGEEHERV